MVVVPDGHSGNGRLAGALDVPTRSVQVHPVAERRSRLRPVGVVGHHGIVVRGQAAAQDPVVAAEALLLAALEFVRFHGEGRLEPLEVVFVGAELGRHVLGPERRRAAERPVELENVVIDQVLAVDGRVELDVRLMGMERRELTDALGAEHMDGPSERERRAGVTEQAAMPRDHDLRRPVVGLDAEHLELDG